MISPSGGLVYHARALREFNRWRSTRRLVSQCLKLWLQRSAPEHLVIFGPSSGYLFEPDSFHGLKQLTVVEPDRTAHFVFKKRHLGSVRVPVKWTTDPKLLPHTSYNDTDFEDFLRTSSRHQKTAIFFAGILGQLEFHRESFRRDECLAQHLLKQQLESYSWASLHDLESKTLCKRSSHHLTHVLTHEDHYQLPREFAANQGSRIDWLERCLMKEETKYVSTPELSFESASLSAPRTEWIDHGTSWLGNPELAIIWRLTPRRLHTLGFLANS
jgi:hypothetical protein